MNVSHLPLLVLYFLFGINSVEMKTQDLRYLNPVNGGKLDGVKTVKIYNYNAANGNIKSNYASYDSNKRKAKT